VTTIHDKIRESLEESARSPAATKHTWEGAEPQKLSEQKSLSKGAVLPFQYREAENFPSMPGLPGVAERMPRCANPIASAFQGTTANDMRRQMGEVRRSRMSQEDQAQFYAYIRDLRSDAILSIDALIKYDDGIDYDQIPKLQDALIVLAHGSVSHV
jgi:hypothetical protein